jgi:hypothetical protein
MRQQTVSIQKNITPKKVFISYSHQDEPLKNLLMLTFRTLESEGYIKTWHDRMILAGQEWDETIRTHLESSELVLLLVSEAFLLSGYCRRVEMEIALRRLKQKKTYIIPIILLNCDWKKELYAKLLALPTDGQPLFKANGAPYPHRLQQAVEGLRFALLGLWSNSNDDDTFGATIGTLSNPIAETETVESNPNIKLLEPSKPFIPLLLKGLKISEYANTLNFLIDSGQTGYAVHSPAFELERKRVMDYFWESLAVDGEQQWVNLSPYDSSRMLPEALSGTRLGHDMLAFDLKLKELSASLLHPDSTSGRIYWKELYQRARTIIGTTSLPFQSFHTITVSASKAKVFEPQKPWVREAPTQAIKDFLSEPYLKAAIVVGYRLQATCEPDSITEARMSGVENNSLKIDQRTAFVSNLAVQVFREVIIPAIEYELNEGEIFAFNRQLFVSMILASWLKVLAKEDSLVGKELAKYIDKNRPELGKDSPITVTHLTEFGPGTSQRISEQPTGYLSPNDPAFRVPENILFYQQYLRLFRSGLYRIVRTEQGDSPGQMISRVYFSGAVELSSIPVSRAGIYCEHT